MYSNMVDVVCSHKQTVLLSAYGFMPMRSSEAVAGVGSRGAGGHCSAVPLYACEACQLAAQTGRVRDSLDPRKPTILPSTEARFAGVSEWHRRLPPRKLRIKHPIPSQAISLLLAQ